MLVDNSEGDAPTSFAPLLASFEMGGNYYHAFKSEGTTLKQANFAGEILARDDGSGQALQYRVSDAVRVALIRDLLEAVVWCHLQGVPHLALDATSVRLHKAAPEPGRRRGFWHLSVVGIGAGPQLISKTSPYQVGNESFAFNPPETLSGALIVGNLPGLFAWDSWTAGVLLTMICGGYTTSPFAAEPRLNDFTFSPQAAVLRTIRAKFGDMSDLLSRLNRDGGGFLFRHGWVVELVVGLLKMDPGERISITAAWEIMSAALAAARSPSRVGRDANKSRESGGRAGERKPVPPPGARPGAIEALSASQMDQLRVAFDNFDLDSSGDIDSEEIVGAMSNMGVKVTLAEATKMIKEVDQDGDGKLNFTEFVLMSQDILIKLPASDKDFSSMSSASSSLTPSSSPMAAGVQPLSASSVFGRRLTSTEGEPFRSLESMITIADKGLSEVLIQQRAVTDSWDDAASPESIGELRNYGEVVGFRNRADGDRWDILAPGLPAQLPAGSRHRLSNVLGVILIKGGNHKLVVALEGNRPDAAAVKKDIKTFVETYRRSHSNVRTNQRIRYLELGDSFGRPAGTLEVPDLQLGIDE